MTGPESVLIALGSNIEPARNLRRAVELIATEMKVGGVSRAWESPPVGDSDGASTTSLQPPRNMFLNAAIEIACRIPPRELKYDLLRPLERRLGRERGPDKNAPRTIDLDIALFGDQVLLDRAADLEIPDPSILTYAHVALPLADVAPRRRHPVDGRSLAQIAEAFRENPRIRPVPGLLRWPAGASGATPEEENR